jgi:acyl-coenzyme A synthetase/AMP-(fatty) acid ligase
VEALARAIPGVTDAVAVGFPLEGGRPVALTLFVLTPTPSDALGDAVSAAIRATVEPFLVPRAVVCCREFPLNANGKVDRAALLQSLLSSTQTQETSAV